MRALSKLLHGRALHRNLNFSFFFGTELLRLPNLLRAATGFFGGRPRLAAQSESTFTSPSEHHSKLAFWCLTAGHTARMEAGQASTTNAEE